MLSLIGEGLTNRQIAEQMFLAEKTVKNYVSSLLASWAWDAAPRPRSSRPVCRRTEPRSPLRAPARHERAVRP